MACGSRGHGLRGLLTGADTQRHDIRVEPVKVENVHLICEMWYNTCPNLHHTRGLLYPAVVGVVSSVLVRMFVVVKLPRKSAHQAE